MCVILQSVCAHACMRGSTKSSWRMRAIIMNISSSSGDGHQHVYFVTQRIQTNGAKCTNSSTSAALMNYSQACTRYPPICTHCPPTCARIRQNAHVVLHSSDGLEPGSYTMADVEEACRSACAHDFIQVKSPRIECIDEDLLGLYYVCG